MLQNKPAKVIPARTAINVQNVKCFAQTQADKGKRIQKLNKDFKYNSVTNFGTNRHTHTQRHSQANSQRAEFST